MGAKIELHVNGSAQTLEETEGRTLLYHLREDLGLTGTKYGCGEGQCGACTVLVDGKPVRSCITPTRDLVGKTIQTIEGLGAPGRLHPVQRAFLEEGAMQCGYCVPGMIMNAAGLLGKNASPSRAEIIEAMNGNICRCCSYPTMLTAIENAARMAKEETK